MDSEHFYENELVGGYVQFPPATRVSADGAEEQVPGQRRPIIANSGGGRGQPVTLTLGDAPGEWPFGPLRSEAMPNDTPSSL